MGSDGGGKGGVVESDGGEREEWEGWGLMEGGECRWAIVVHVHARRPVQGHSLCVGGMSSLSKGGTLLSVGGSRLVVTTNDDIVVALSDMAPAPAPPPILPLPL